MPEGMVSVTGWDFPVRKERRSSVLPINSFLKIVKNKLHNEYA
jgi:hypothetical protein